MMRSNSKKIKERSNIALNSKSTWSNRSNQYPIAKIGEISSYYFTVMTRLPCYVGCSSRIWFRDWIITHIPLNEKKNIFKSISIIQYSKKISKSCHYSSYPFTVLTWLPRYVGYSSRIWFRDWIITHISLNEKTIYISKGLRQIVEHNIYIQQNNNPYSSFLFARFLLICPTVRPQWLVA